MILAAAAVLVVAACGDDDGDSASVETTTTSTTPAPDVDWSGRVEVDPETGEFTAPGFNELIDAQQPAWAATPSGAAEVLLHLGDGAGSPEGPTVELTEETDEQGRPVVVVTQSGLADDSIAATRHRVVFESGDDGLVRFVSGSFSQRRQPGRGQQDFAVGLCA